MRGEPTRYLVGHQRIVGTLAALPRLREERLRIGASAQQISLAAGMGGKILSELEGVVGRRTSRERCEAVVAALRSVALAAGVAFDATLNDLFTDAYEPQGPVRRRTFDATPPEQRGDGRHFKTASDEAAAYRKAQGLVNRGEAAVLLKAAPSFVTRLVDRGLLSPVESGRGILGEELFDPAVVTALVPEVLERWRQDGRAPRKGGHLAKMTPLARSRWAGRVGGWEAPLKAAAHGAKVGRPRAYSSEQAIEVVELRRKHPEWGVRHIAERVGLSKDQAHEILKSVTLPIGPACDPEEVSGNPPSSVSGNPR